MTKYTTEQLRAIFQRPFDQESWKTIVRDVFKASSLRSKPERFTLPDDPEQGYYFGAIDTPDNYRIGVFFYKISHGSVAHKKVGLRNLVKKFVNTKWGEFDAALVVFSDGKEWRLSFVCDIKEVATAPKRFTFVFGEHDNFYRTAIERFNILQGGDASFENIRKAFSVDALSDDFFDQYRELYADFCQYITGKRYVKEGGKWVERELCKPNPQYVTTFNAEDKLVRDYIKKMFGRIVFLYFLQRKGWLDGNRQYMHDLFANSSQKDNFLDGVLEPLFFEVLNTDKQYRTVGARALPGSENIPYLNGGLFAQDEIDALECVFPENYFKRLFDFLDSYNFTIDENDTDDAEVGIDPEMLGRIFENLLEDNKDKGAFYTPKEIVDYMCRESIIAYLQDDKFSSEGNTSIRQFVETLDAESLNAEQKIYLRRKLQAVKICDPAIGSGAFPMGLVNLLSKLYVAMKADTDTAKMKRHIMEQNIYGVDIEKGAVDIARLRFWLAMIVEEKEPMPLPNLHFKIMQGNSLLESYNGIDLSDLTKVSSQKSLFDSDDSERESLLNDLKKYYQTSDHNRRDRIFNDIINNVRRQLFSKGITLPQDMDPSANESFFLWHTWFADVFDNGGFDIVIGNPPYGATLSQEDKATYRRIFPETQFKIDTYSLFVLQASKFLNKDGVASYIIPNTLLDNYFEGRVRYKLLTQYKIIEVNDLNDKVFDGPVVHAMIFSFVNKQENNYNIKINISETLTGATSLVESSYFLNQDNYCISLRTHENKNLIDKLLIDSIPLCEVLDIRQAIKTGDDKTYISKEKSDIFDKPILRGKDVFRYTIIPPNLYLNYGKHLACPRNKSIFEQPKILIREAGAYITASLDEDNYYIMSSLYNAILLDESFNLRYILALINSKLFQFLMNKLTFEKTKGAFTKAKIFHYYKLPVKRLKNQNFFVSLVNSILEAKKRTRDADTSRLEKNLDMGVYYIYDLTYDEILIIDPETSITRNDYENFKL